MISMNYENVYRYLCFCCADAVDCGAALPRYIVFTLTLVLSRQGRGGIGRLFWACCCPAHPAPLDCGSSPQ